MTVSLESRGIGAAGESAATSYMIPEKAQIAASVFWPEFII
jgi:hypothetical protein